LTVRHVFVVSNEQTDFNICETLSSTAGPETLALRICHTAQQPTITPTAIEIQMMTRFDMAGRSRLTLWLTDPAPVTVEMQL